MSLIYLNLAVEITRI